MKYSYGVITELSVKGNNEWKSIFHTMSSLFVSTKLFNDVIWRSSGLFLKHGDDKNSNCVTQSDLCICLNWRDWLYFFLFGTNLLIDSFRTLVRLFPIRICEVEMLLMRMFCWYAFSATLMIFFLRNYFRFRYDNWQTLINTVKQKEDESDTPKYSLRTEIKHKFV